ncbi:MAG TPA: putative phage abortive infection protein [Longimicrobium sp.]|nr:putative phage abortive infection protein [Longimicrobium sp.]
MAIFRRRDPRDHEHPAAAVWPLVAVLASATAIYLLYWWFVDWLNPPADTDGAGTFGDKFGGLNALFSAFAFAGILYTVLLQRHEIERQRRQMLEADRDQEREAFERRFFRLIDLYIELVGAMRAPSVMRAGRSVPPVEGRGVLDRFSTDLGREIQSYTAEQCSTLSDEELRDRFHSELRMNDFLGNPSTGPYTAHLLFLFSYLDRAPEATREFYMNLVHAQLSPDELLWIFCYSLAPDGSEMKRLVERLGILKDWHWRTPLLLEMARRFMISSAFGPPQALGARIVHGE